MNLGFLKDEIKSFGVKKMKDITGLSRSHINGIMQGRVEPKVSTLNKMLNELGYGLEIIKLKNKSHAETDLLKNINYLKWAMCQYKMPIRSHDEYSYLATPTEVLNAVIAFDNLDSEVQTALPVFIHKFSHEIVWEKIISSNVNNLLGYNLELVKYITKTNHLDLTIEGIRKSLIKNKKLGSLIAKFEQESKSIKASELKKHAPEATMFEGENYLAAIWNIKNQDSLKIIKQKFNRYI